MVIDSVPRRRDQETIGSRYRACLLLDGMTAVRIDQTTVDTIDASTHKDAADAWMDRTGRVKPLHD